MQWLVSRSSLSSIKPVHRNISPCIIQGLHSGPVVFAGHSKWMNIRHRKKAVDEARAGTFRKLSQEITVAVKLGGKDINSNARLVVAISKAKSLNLPKQNIEQALAKGLDVKDLSVMEEIIYECNGPGGVALLVQILTANKHRSAQVIRTILSKSGGNMGVGGSVAYLFDKKGFIIFDGKGKTEEELFEFGLGLDAEDINVLPEENNKRNVEVVCDKNKLIQVKIEIEKNGFTCQNSEFVHIPNSTVDSLAPEEEEQLQELLNALEDGDDVSQVHHNYAGFK